MFSIHYGSYTFKTHHTKVRYGIVLRSIKFILLNYGNAGNNNVFGQCVHLSTTDVVSDYFGAITSGSFLN